MLPVYTIVILFSFYFLESKKCLKVINKSPEKEATVSEAMVQCALDGARLVPLRNCQELRNVLWEVWDRHRLEHTYHIGLHLIANATIKPNLVDKRNLHLHPVIDR